MRCLEGAVRAALRALERPYLVVFKSPSTCSGKNSRLWQPVVPLQRLLPLVYISPTMLMGLSLSALGIGVIGVQRPCLGVLWGVLGSGIPALNPDWQFIPVTHPMLIGSCAR